MGSLSDLAFLAESGKVLAASLDIDEVADALVRLVVPRLADWSVLDYGDAASDAPNRRCGALAKEGSAGGAIEDRSAPARAHDVLLQRLPVGAEEVLALEPALVAELLAGSTMIAADRYQGGSAVAIAVDLHGVRLGYLVLGCDAGRPCGGDDLRMIREIAGRGGMALFNARRFQQARMQIKVNEEALRKEQDHTRADGTSAEEESRKNDRRFRAVIDNSRDPIWLLSAGAAILYASPSTVEVLGYEPEEILGRTYPEFIHPDDAGIMLDHFNRLLSVAGIRITAQFRGRHKDGTWRWIEAGGTNMLADPALHAIITNLRDITDRKRAEEDLHNRARQQAAVSKFGLQALTGMDIKQLLDEGVRLVAQVMDVELCKFLELLPDGGTLLVTSGVGWQSGVVGVATVPVERHSQAGYTLLCSEPVIVDDLKTETRFIGTSLLHDHGVVSGISVIVHGLNAPYGILGAHTARHRSFSWDDVHFMQAIANIVGEALARKQTDKALHTSEQHYRALIENSYDVTALFDSAGVFLYASPSTTRLLGYPTETFVGRGIFEFIHPDDVEYCYGLLGKCMETIGASVVGQFRMIHRSGAWRWIEGTGTTFITDAGEVALIANYHDITERRKAEMALTEAKETAEAANLAKDQFLAVLSHELRTPLTPVITAVEVLKEEPDISQENGKLLEIIQRNVELEARLIDDLLDLTRITNSKLKLNLEHADLHSLVHSALGISKGDIKGKRLNVTLDLCARMCVVKGDPARLQQVLWNLIKNAVKFTPDHGRIIIRSTNVDDRIRVVIADSGIGIEPHVLPHIFNAFEQGEKTITRRFGGLGLGLAISRTIVDLHGGTLTASSQGRNMGATFTLDLEAIAEIH